METNPRIALLSGSPADWPLLAPVAAHLPGRERLTLYRVQQPRFTIWDTACTNWEEFLREFQNRHTSGLRPGDVLVLAGDRHETLCFAVWARQLGCRIHHIGGGETPSALMLTLRHAHPDHHYRDCISLLACRHYVANGYAASNLASLLPADVLREQVLITGLPSLDRVHRYLQQESISRSKQSGVIVFAMHSNPAERDGGAAEFDAAVNWLDLLLRRGRVSEIWYSTVGNDRGHTHIQMRLEQLNAARPDLWRPIPRSEDGLAFLRLLVLAEFAVGNSSALRLEAGITCTPVLELGTRQYGRLIPAHVSVCPTAVLDPALLVAEADRWLASLTPISVENNLWGHPEGLASQLIARDLCTEYML